MKELMCTQLGNPNRMCRRKDLIGIVAFHSVESVGKAQDWLWIYNKERSHQLIAGVLSMQLVDCSFPITL
jgi:hypothetical protein